MSTKTQVCKRFVNRRERQGQMELGLQLAISAIALALVGLTSAALRIASALDNIAAALKQPEPPGDRKPPFHESAEKLWERCRNQSSTGVARKG